ncbi:MAG: glycoside hydrolase family 9 protein [Pontibacterium sp.]
MTQLPLHSSRSLPLWLSARVARVLCTLSFAGTLVAASLPSWAKTQLVHVSAVAPDVISIEIKDGERIGATQAPYSEGFFDQIEIKDRHRWIRQAGDVAGALVGPDDNIIYGFDRFSAGSLNLTSVDSTSSYRISSADDSAFKNALSPKAVFRKSKPADMARTGFWQFDWPMQHTLYLQLPKPLVEGKSYEISLANSSLPTISYKHNSRLKRSEAVHASQIGFRSDDPQKLAFVSVWRGNGGGQPYPNTLNFEVINSQTNKIVLKGKSRISRRASESEDIYLQNYNGSDVLQLDFSSLSSPGQYRVCVIRIGCSYDFAIGNNTWQTAFVTSARGLYHQRNGIAIGAPYSDYQRPRNMHPDDGVKVYQSRTPLMDTQNGINAKGTANDNFAELIQGKTGTIVEDAWGGYADAGDWDRRIQHLFTTRLMLELVELFPQYYEALSLNIPESNNTLPDLLDESLWGLDFFRRLQLPNGGVRGGIESEEHPRHGEGSWQESQTLMAYAPGVWSSYIYAGVAARAAGVLERYDNTLAQTYRDSALRAMQWAESEAQGNHSTYPAEVRDERNLAAAELFRLTGDDQWHRIFKQTSFFAKGPDILKKWQSHDQTEAAFVYTLTRNGDKRLRQNAAQSILNEAKQSIDMGNKTAFKWTKRDPWAWLGWGNMTVPSAQSLVRAHYITGNQQYLRAAVNASLFGAGANPLNLVYTTGVGQNPVKHPLLQDYRVSNQPAPPGITVNGPLETKRQLNHWFIKLFQEHIYPQHAEWPTTEAYFDVYDIAVLNEFTVQSTIGPNAYIWGYLAARPALKAGQ